MKPIPSHPLRMREICECHQHLTSFRGAPRQRRRRHLPGGLCSGCSISRVDAAAADDMRRQDLVDVGGVAIGVPDPSG